MHLNECLVDIVLVRRHQSINQSIKQASKQASEQANNENQIDWDHITAMKYILLYRLLFSIVALNVLCTVT